MGLAPRPLRVASIEKVAWRQDSRLAGAYFRQIAGAVNSSMRHDRKKTPGRGGTAAFEGIGAHPATAAAERPQSLSADAAALGGPGRGYPRSLDAHTGEFRHRGDERPG